MKKNTTLILVFSLLVGVGALTCYALPENKEVVFHSPEFWEDLSVEEPMEVDGLLEIDDPIEVETPVISETPVVSETPVNVDTPVAPDQSINVEEPVALPVPKPVEPTRMTTSAFSADLSWSRESTSPSLTTCLVLAVSAPTSIEVNRDEGANETFSVGTGSVGLLLTPLCHTYSTAGIYDVEIDGDGIIYLDVGRQAIKSFNGASSPSLTYLSLVENTLTSNLITTLFPSLPALQELNLADTALSISDYNDLLVSLSGSVSTGIVTMGFLQYGGCSEALSGEATTAHTDLTTAGWTLIDGGLATCVAPTPEPSSSSNGGGSLKKDVCPNGDFSPSYYDDECGETEKEPTSPDEESDKNQNENSPKTIYETAYERAKEYGITTASTYEEARTTDAILRQEMAKMISTYAIKLFQKTPDTSKVDCSQFHDLSQAGGDLQPYIIQSCELGLMGMNGDGIGVQENFFPTRTITRAEVGTVLSRLLRGTQYATQLGDETYYGRHLQALKKAGIMNFISNPDMVELRGNILLMLWKSVVK